MSNVSKNTNKPVASSQNSSKISIIGEWEFSKMLPRFSKKLFTISDFWIFLKISELWKLFFSWSSVFDFFRFQSYQHFITSKMAERLLAVSVIVLVMIENALSDDHRPPRPINTYCRITTASLTTAIFVSGDWKYELNFSCASWSSASNFSNMSAFVNWIFSACCLSWSRIFRARLVVNWETSAWEQHSTSVWQWSL